MSNDIKIKLNNNMVRQAFNEQAMAGLEEIGLRAEGYAAALTPVDTGNLRNSITHKVSGEAVYIGSNLKYAPYVELGTGIYATDGTGRKSPWVYIDKDGIGHRTNGMKPNHMIKKAASEHNDEYKDVLKKHLKNE